MSENCGVDNDGGYDVCMKGGTVCEVCTYSTDTGV